ncbi:MAG: hypothetical protein RQ732_00005 [Methylophaga sp.]|nr:hypothetical protein [Methylophaga sp.]
MHLKSGRILGLLAASLLLLASSADKHVASQQDTVRLAVVNTPYDSGLLDALLPAFSAETGLNVEIYSGNQVFEQARQGAADIVIAHYGKSGMAEFVQDKRGSWPQMVFANQAVLIGLAADPAKVSEAHSLLAAFAAIEQSGHTLIANNNEGISELTATVLTMMGHAAEPDWYQDSGVSKGRAIKAAEKQGAYVIWGAVPFLKFQQKHQSDMQILLAADPLLQRIMAISRVLPTETIKVNEKGAEALETYLLHPDIQAKIMQYRMPGSDASLWWPAARHN